MMASGDVYGWCVVYGFVYGSFVCSCWVVSVLNKKTKMAKQRYLCVIQKKGIPGLFPEAVALGAVYQCRGEYFEGDKAHSVAGMFEKIYKKIVQTF
jgi:hypothetical protein